METINTTKNEPTIAAIELVGGGGLQPLKSHLIPARALKELFPCLFSSIMSIKSTPSVTFNRINSFLISSEIKC